MNGHKVEMTLTANVIILMILTSLVAIISGAICLILDIANPKHLLSKLDSYSFALLKG